MARWQENKADGLAKIARERSKFASDKQSERYSEGQREAAYVEEQRRLREQAQINAHVKDE